MISITRIGTFVKEHFLVVALFVLLGFGLLLGDGKQALVDVYMAAGVLGLCVVARYCLKKQRNIPSIQGLAWSGLLTYLLIRTVFSDDVGYSIYTFNRYVEAFLVYYLFVCYSNKNTTRVFTGALIVFSVFVLTFAVVLTLFPYFMGSMPQMNLLYRTYGHNHAADLVVFGFSAATILWVQTKLRRYLALMLLFIAGTVFCLARAVFMVEAILLNGTLLYVLIWKKYISKTLLIIGPILAIATIVLFFIPYANLRTVSRIFPNYAKQSVLENGRWEYWRQAAVAIRQRPWFGSGPGTFYLQSTLYQKEPSAYSWFAHNFLLENITETGLVGLAFLIFVVVATAGNNKVKLTRFNVALLAALCLVFSQSLFDYNLDYLVVWLLVWAIVGAVFSQAVKPDHRVTYSPVCAVPVFFIGIFYIMNMFLLCGKNIIQYSPLYVPLCAYDLSCADSLLSQKYSMGKESSIAVDKAVQFFHRKNPQVLIKLARRMALKDSTVALTLYRGAVAGDPQNVDYLTQYVSALLNSNEKTRIGKLLETKGQQVRPQSSWRTLQSVDWSSSAIVSLFTKSFFADVGQPTTVSEYLSKTFYFLGFSLLNSDPTTTRNLWTHARDLSPEWGYFHIELASLEYHVLDDKEGARNTLTHCMEFIFAAAQCRHTKPEDTNVGDSYEYIKAIPALR